jgi:hypothetical protein
MLGVHLTLESLPPGCSQLSRTTTPTTTLAAVDWPLLPSYRLYKQVYKNSRDSHPVVNDSHNITVDYNRPPRIYKLRFAANQRYTTDGWSMIWRRDSLLRGEPPVTLAVGDDRWARTVGA